MYHERKKHIDVRHHFIRDSVFGVVISMEKIFTKDNLANMLTKALLNECEESVRPMRGILIPQVTKNFSQGGELLCVVVVRSVLMHLGLGG